MFRFGVILIMELVEKKDLFITNPDYTPVEEFETIRFMDKNIGDFKPLIQELNGKTIEKR